MCSWCWNDDKCQCECKELIDKGVCGRCKCKELIDKGVCDKGYAWNPSNCECECDRLWKL